METNPEVDQDRAFDLYDTYRKYGYVMFPQQRKIYQQLQSHCNGKHVLEVGCGNGVGSAMLSRVALSFFATDKSENNIKFARELYPWVNFGVGDVQEQSSSRTQVVVAVEIIEHVANPATALRNLINVATETVWISTPNGRLTQHEKPPSNPYHVAEYTPEEMLGMIHGACAGRPVKVYIYAYDDFKTPLTIDTDKNPLVYRIDLQ